MRPQGLAAADDRPAVRPSFPPLKQPPAVLDEDHPRRVAFSPDGWHLAVWGANYELFVYDAGRRERLWKQKHAQAMDLSADGHTVAVLEHTRGSEPADRLVLRACATGKPLRREPWRPGPELTALACVSGGRVVVADAADTLHVLDLATQQSLKTVPRVKQVRRLGAAGDRLLAHIQAFDAGAMMLTGPSAVKLFDLTTGEVVSTWAGASVFAASADGALVALGSVGERSPRASPSRSTACSASPPTRTASACGEPDGRVGAQSRRATSAAAAPTRRFRKLPGVTPTSSRKSVMRCAWS